MVSPSLAKRRLAASSAIGKATLSAVEPLPTRVRANEERLRIFERLQHSADTKPHIEPLP
jgi:hypothetical protein